MVPIGGMGIGADAIAEKVADALWRDATDMRRWVGAAQTSADWELRYSVAAIVFCIDVRELDVAAEHCKEALRLLTQAAGSAMV